MRERAVGRRLGKLRPCDIAVVSLRKLYGDRLEGVMLFGSRARGDEREDSDYDVLILVSSYVWGPLEDYFQAYRALKPFRERVLKDTTVAVISLDDLQESVSTSPVLNALCEGVVLYDREGRMGRAKGKLVRKLKELGVRRVKEEWGYTWLVPADMVPFRLSLDLDDPAEFEYRLRLALEHLGEARKALMAGALIAAAHEAQQAIENAAKSVIAVFKPPSWVHNPAPELRGILQTHAKIISRASSLEGRLRGLAEIAEEAAPHHAISSYGDVRGMVTPAEVYREGQVKELVDKAERAVAIARGAIGELTAKTRSGSSPGGSSHTGARKR
ncbi:TPA: HEPN domain-containing protein [Candidatus Bathyarchaeota archaeon]|nr:HEPN domain-containing protein [Candidatus Bathyarchaeota archaeon]